MQPTAVTLSQLSAFVRQIVDEADISTWIVAEIHSVSFSKHCYIECVEKSEFTGDIVAKMKFNIWSNVASTLISKFETETEQTFQVGLKIMFYASLHYHEVFGLSGTITKINSEFTLGDLERQRRETINRLTEEGVADMNKMFQLPLAIKNVAVVSSDSAAGYGDFCNQIANNAYGLTFNIQLFPAIVQGREAPQSIIAALDQIAQLSESPDVVVIIRGGGSKADLLCFDDYELACNVAQFPCPVITGIGHERDNSVCDMVAHTRTKTPTAAAEFIITHNADLLSKLETMRSDLSDLAFEILQRMQRQTDVLKMHLMANTQGRVATKLSYIERLHTQLRLTATNKIHADILQVKQRRLMLQQMAMKLVRDENKKISTLQQLLDVYNPTDTLRRGFTITTLNGKRLNKVDGITKGNVLHTLTSNGTIVSVVDTIELEKL